MPVPQSVLSTKGSLPGQRENGDVKARDEGMIPMRARRSSWMLVTLRIEKGPKLWIPFPIWFVDEALRGLWILAWCLPWLSRWPHRFAAKHSIPLPQGFSVKRLLGQALELLEGIRRAGPFTLVQVHDGDTDVLVRLV